MKLLTIGAVGLFLSAPLAHAGTFTYFVGDIDSFGGAGFTDNRSAAEASATNGAQFTDLRDGNFGYQPFTDDDMPIDFSFDIDLFSSITSMTVEIFSLGIQSNDADPNTNLEGEDALLFEGDLVAEYFAGVDQGPDGTGLLSGAIDAGLFDNALDGTADFTILLNSFAGTSSPLGEPAAFDYFSLTVEGELASTPAVPLPASLPLLAAAFGGLAWMRRKS